jgi:hypothetical protein
MFLASARKQSGWCYNISVSDWQRFVKRNLAFSEHLHWLIIAQVFIGHNVLEAATLLSGSLASEANTIALE